MGYLLRILRGCGVNRKHNAMQTDTLLGVSVFFFSYGSIDFVNWVWYNNDKGQTPGLLADFMVYVS